MLLQVWINTLIVYIYIKVFLVFMGVHFYAEQEFSGIWEMIQKQSWYTSSQNLQHYLESEWMSCTAVSNIAHLFYFYFLLSTSFSL